MVCAARERVSFLPGEACRVGETADNHLRLNFSFPSVRQIRVGVQRLAHALEEASAKAAPRPTAGNETRPIT
jgi:DNA-binding transcriptional MocR family regulator